MPNFSVQIRGEPEPRGFRFDVEENALYTDIEIENKRGGMEDQRQLKVTEATAQNDPQAMMYWEQTAIYREAYRICEDEGLTFEEAFEKAVAVASDAVGSETVPPPLSERPWVDKSDPVTVTQDAGPDLADEEEPAIANPMAGIVITNQQLIMGALLILVEHPDDAHAKLIEYFKTKMEEIDGYEIVI